MCVWILALKISILTFTNLFGMSLNCTTKEYLGSILWEAWLGMKKSVCFLMDTRSKSEFIFYVI